MKYISIKICLVILALFSVAATASDLPDCPQNVYHNCISTYTYANGGQYVGEWKNRKKHGQGILTTADGEQYIGEFTNDNFHGKGILTYTDGSKYIGEFRDGKRNGYGILTYADGEQYIGEFKNGKFNGKSTLSPLEKLREFSKSGISKYIPTPEELSKDDK